MFVVRGTIPVDPESRDEAKALLSDVAEKSRSEAGIIDYRISVDVDDPNRLRIFEQYEDDEAFETHMETDHIDEFMSRLPDLLDGDVEATRFDVESSSELDF